MTQEIPDWLKKTGPIINAQNEEKNRRRLAEVEKRHNEEAVERTRIESFIPIDKKISDLEKQWEVLELDRIFNDVAKYTPLFDWYSKPSRSLNKEKGSGIIVKRPGTEPQLISATSYSDLSSFFQSSDGLEVQLQGTLGKRDIHHGIDSDGRSDSYTTDTPLLFIRFDDKSLKAVGIGPGFEIQQQLIQSSIVEHKVDELLHDLLVEEPKRKVARDERYELTKRTAKEYLIDEYFRRSQDYAGINLMGQLFNENKKIDPEEIFKKWANNEWFHYYKKIVKRAKGGLGTPIYKLVVLGLTETGRIGIYLPDNKIWQANLANVRPNTNRGRSEMNVNLKNALDYAAQRPVLYSFESSTQSSYER